MRIAVMGAGGVGGYFGGLLARAGNDVTLIARGDHLEAIRARGLTVKGYQGEFNVKVRATDDTAGVGPVELAILSVKTYQSPAAIPALLPMLKEGSCVLALQNGVGSYLEAAAVVGKGRVLPGAVYIETGVESPGVIKQQGQVVRIVFGEAGGDETPRARRILDTLTAAQIPAQLSPNVLKELWTKFLFIATMGGVSSSARAPMSRLLALDPSRRILLDCMREVEAVGRAMGIDLDQDVVERTMAYMDAEAESLRASMHSDLDAGRPLELEALNGAVVRMGRQADVPTPVNDVLYALLLPHREGVGGATPAP
jgi:2-dehydropantoate 2-reductase